MLEVIYFVLAGYLLGALPFGYWVVKLVKNVDIRNYGSGSTGTTNVLRVAGKGWALVVLIADVLKGYLPVFFAVRWEQSADVANYANSDPLVFYVLSWHILAPLVALTCLVGHSKSIFLGGGGGKSAATGLGTLLALNAMAAALTFGSWIAIVFISRLVSLASIMAVLFSIPLMYFCQKQDVLAYSYVAYCILAAAYVILRHMSNIGRLIAGTEPKIGQKVAVSEEDKLVPPDHK